MERHKIIRQVVRVAIIGPINAGKSSLLNILAKRDAAIVSPIVGMTWDIVEVIMDLGVVRCIILDTAGIRDTVRQCIPSLFFISPRLQFILVFQFILLCMLITLISCVQSLPFFIYICIYIILYYTNIIYKKEDIIEQEDI